MKKLNYLKAALIAAIICPAIGNAQNKIKPNAEVVKLIDKNFADADEQYHLLVQHVPVDSNG